MTHAELVNIAYSWLRKKCGCVVKEYKSLTNEIPDVLGFRSDSTWIIECKASRSDFLADKNKSHRKNPQLGMGDFRFYCSPKGMIQVSELPELWGLIEVDANGRAICVFNPFGKGNIYSTHKRHTKNSKEEYLIMYSLLRRCQIRGYIDTLQSEKQTQ